MPEAHGARLLAPRLGVMVAGAIVLSALSAPPVMADDAPRRALSGARIEASRRELAAARDASVSTE